MACGIGLNCDSTTRKPGWVLRHEIALLRSARDQLFLSEVQAKTISVGTMAERFGGRCEWLFSTGVFSLVLRRRSRASSFYPNPTRFWRNRVRNSYGEVTQRPHVKVNYKVVVTEVDGSREPMITCSAPRILRLGLRLRHYYLFLQSLSC
jgi:hypothetical protein